MPNPTGTSRDFSSGLFKTVYRDEEITKTINTKAKLYAMFPRVAQEEGSSFKTFIETALPSAGRPLKGDWGDIAKPRPGTTVQAEFNYNVYDFPIRGSDRAERSGGSIQKPLVRELSRSAPAIGLDYEHELFAGTSGVLSACVSASDSTTLKVDSHRMLLPGMTIDVVVSASGVLSAGVREAVISIVPNRTDGTAILTLSKELATYGSIDSTYGVVLDGSWGEYNWGLNEILSASNPASGSIGGISRATAGNEYMKVLVRDNAGAPLTGASLADLLADVIAQIGMTPTMCLVAPYVANRLVSEERMRNRGALFSKDFPLFGKRTVMPTLDGEDIPIIGHRFMPRTEAWLLHMPSFMLAHPSSMPADGEWSKGDDGQVFYRVPDKLGRQAVWWRMSQLVCNNMLAQAKVTGLEWSHA